MVIAALCMMTSTPLLIGLFSLAVSLPLTRAEETNPRLADFLDQALAAPEINTHPNLNYADEARDFSMVIGMDRTPKGRLWACWVAGGDNQDGYFVAATSDNDGATWSKPRLVIDPALAPGPIKRRTLVGNFWTDPNGKLWLFFDQSMGYFDGRSGVWATTCENPDAEAPVWSAPVRLWHGATLNKPTVLRSGEWLLPVSLWDQKKISPAYFKENFHELDDLRMANILVSKDQGATWTRRGGVRFPHSEFDEHMIVELKDGRLWMLARTDYGGIAESYSANGGETWSLPQPSTLRNPSSRHFIRRLKSGRLLLVKNGPTDVRLPGRSLLTAYLSDDDGKTWQGGLVLDERTGVSYPDGFEAPDGVVHILYDHNRSTDAEILMAKFREEDVLAGRFQSAGAKDRVLVNKPTGGTWKKQVLADAAQDRTVVAYDGIKPNTLVCDTTLRELPDGSWVMFMLAGGMSEPSPENYTGVTRSIDHGATWSPLETFDTGLPRSGSTIGQGPTELIVDGQRCTLFFSTHSKHWGYDWKSWTKVSEDGGHTWGKPEPLAGRLADFTFIRNHIVLRDGRLMAPYQHYLGPKPEAVPPTDAPNSINNTLSHFVSNPRNGVIISNDGGKTWTEHGEIRLTTDDHYHGWAENNIVEFANGRVVMIIRGDRLGGMLYSAESLDGGNTWPQFATKTDIPNPGSKATLYPLGGEAVAMLHNPNPKRRSPLSLWISFDGMKTWPYRRVLVPESSDGSKGRLNYPDGFVSKDRQYLYFAYDDNRHRAVFYAAKLPPLP